MQVGADVQFATAAQLVQTRLVVGVQAVASQVPAAQVVAQEVQLPAPAAEYVPASQGEHVTVVPPSDEVPAEHCVQVLFAVAVPGE